MIEFVEYTTDVFLLAYYRSARVLQLFNINRGFYQLFPKLYEFIYTLLKDSLKFNHKIIELEEFIDINCILLIAYVIVFYHVVLNTLSVVENYNIIAQIVFNFLAFG